MAPTLTCSTITWLGGGVGEEGAVAAHLWREECAFKPHILQPCHRAAEVAVHEQGQAERELSLVRPGVRHVNRVRSVPCFKVHVAVDVQLHPARCLVRVAAVYDDGLKRTVPMKGMCRLS